MGGAWETAQFEESVRILMDGDRADLWNEFGGLIFRFSVEAGVVRMNRLA